MGQNLNDIVGQLTSPYPQRFVRLVLSGNAYVSSAPCDAQGYYTINGVPNGTYSLQTANSPTAATWTVEDAAFVVASNPPITWDVRTGFNVKSPQNTSGAAVSDEVTDTWASLNAGIQAAMPSGGPCYVPAGVKADGVTPAAYMLAQPLVVAPPNSDTTAQLCAGLIGPASGGRIGDNPNDPSAVTFRVTDAFPSGQFVVDYRNKVAAPAANTALLGPVVGGFSIRNASLTLGNRGAGFRIASPRRADVYNISTDNGILPAPTIAKSSTGAAFTTDDFTGTNTAYNTFRNILVWSSQFDGSQWVIGQSMGFGIFSGACGRFGVTWGQGAGSISQTSLTGVNDDRSQNNFGPQNHSQMMNILGTTHWSGDPGIGGGAIQNNVFAQGSVPATNPRFTDEFVGGVSIGTTTISGENVNAMVRAIHNGASTLIGLRFTNWTFSSQAQTSRWVYTTANVTGYIDMIACTFDTIGGAPTLGNFNQNGANVLRVAESSGLNPLAGLVAPAFPATTVAYTNTTGVDVDAYLTNGTGALTVQVDGDTALAVVPASAVIVVPIPARSTFTPTYAAGAPTWKFKGK